MSHRSSGLLAAMALAVAAALATLLPESSPPRVLLALALVLALPGYALVAAAFPARTLGAAERALLTVGLSLSVGVLGGFALNLTPWGLTARSWAALLGAITLVAGAVGLTRRQRHPSGAASVVRWRLTLSDGLCFGLAALVIVLALGEAHTSAARQPSAGFTQLWLLPAGEAEQDAFRLGIKNMQASPTSYRLRVTAGGEALREWLAITLAPGETWETTVALPPSQSDREHVEAFLYRVDTPGVVYRHALLWRSGGPSVDRIGIER